MTKRKSSRNSQRVEWSRGSAPNGVKGVYILYVAKRGGKQDTLYVGQGHIANRVAAHKREGRGYTRAEVAWAAVSAKKKRDGIERYLAETINPRRGKRWPKAKPIPVNLPRRR